jgi:hypothetical protein
MRLGLARLKLRFPALRETLAAAYAGSTEFQELCGHYEEACQVLENWRRSSSPLAERRAAEYSELARDLEGDVLRLIKNRGSASC